MTNPEEMTMTTTKTFTTYLQTESETNSELAEYLSISKQDWDYNDYDEFEEFIGSNHNYEPEADEDEEDDDMVDEQLWAIKYGENPYDMLLNLFSEYQDSL